MRIKRWMPAVLVVSACAIAFGVVPSIAQTPITAEILTDRAVFTDGVGLKVKVSHGGAMKVVSTKDPSRTVVGRFTVEPQAQFPWHSHAGPVVVNVVSGTLVYVDAATCEERSYPAGTAFVDLGHGDVHSAYNPSNSVDTVIVATFFEAPAAPASLLIPADPADC